MQQLTILSIDNKEFYMCPGRYTTRQMGRFIRKKHLKSYNESEKNVYIKNFCKKKNTPVAATIFECEEIKK